MLGSIIIVSFFLLGLLLSYFHLIPEQAVSDDYTLYALYLLLFCVGISIGSDKTIYSTFKKHGYRMLLLPLATIFGSIGGSALVSLAINDWSLSETISVGCGMGYYSLSSVFITEMKGAELGTIALVSNIVREIIALLFAPILVFVFGRLAPIAAGGATTMDTTLPVIARYSGKEFVVLALFHGFLVDFSVPFLVSFFASI